MIRRYTLIFLILSLHLCLLITLCNCTTAENDLSMTYSQKVALDKFKESVSSKLPHDYMKQDIYLIRWLRAKDFDVDKAEELLIKNLKWREEHDMDHILEGDWSDMMTDYPYNIESRDKEGKPVVIGEFGHWDLRNADVTGRFDRLMRFGERIMEQEESLIRELQAEGKLVTRTIIVFDMDGFNVAQHLCGRCTSFILQFYNSFEDHYPNLLDKIFIINNQPIVQMVLQSILNSFSPKTRDITRVYGRNRAEFSQALLKIISPEQLPERYGGKKKFH